MSALQDRLAKAPGMILAGYGRSYPSQRRSSGIGPTNGASRLDFLDGVRAVAALWVVASHLWISQYGMSARVGMFGLLSNWLLYSHFAVDAFIVLSGYCLALPAIRRQGLRGGVLDFYRRRARRILPPLYIALALAVALAALIHKLDLGTWYVDRSALAVNALLLQDAFLKWNIFDSPLWSVAVEWRIYFLFPILLFVLLRYGRLAALLTAGIAGYAVTAYLRLRYPAMMLMCPWYLFLFAMGSAAALSGIIPVRGGPAAAGVRDQRTPAQCNHANFPSGAMTEHDGWANAATAREKWFLQRPGVLLGGLLIPAYIAVHAHRLTTDAFGGADFGLNMPWIDALVGAVVAVFLLRLHRNQQQGIPSRTVRLLSWPPLVKLGGFSYSIYLVHRLVIIVMVRVLDSQHLALLAEPFMRFALLSTLGLPIIIAVSYLFYRAFERPFAAS
jgi:peptidoglycan/LPS O-acetylase OafA/YrhL